MYDIRIMQVEQHMVEGKLKTLLVHRKGSTRAFPPHHPLIPVDYQFIGEYILLNRIFHNVCFLHTLLSPFSHYFVLY